MLTFRCSMMLSVLVCIYMFYTTCLTYLLLVTTDLVAIFFALHFIRFVVVLLILLLLFSYCSYTLLFTVIL